MNRPIEEIVVDIRANATSLKELQAQLEAAMASVEALYVGINDASIRHHELRAEIDRAIAEVTA